MMMLIQWYQPFETKFGNNIEVFNEACILVFTYYAICFTDFVLDPKVKSNLGYSYIGLNSSMISVHLSILAVGLIRSLKLKCKESCKKNKDIQKSNKIRCISATESNPE